MTADERIALVQTKIERAKHHIADLHGEIKLFLDSKPYKVSTQPDPQTGKLIYYLAKVRAVPDTSSTITGDVVQNLRSSLDHLAYQLYLVGAGVPADPKWQGRFLIERSANEFKSRLGRVVKGMREDAIDAIRAIEPYKGGKGEAFWTLNELNNADKHRLIVTIGSVLHHVKMPVPVEIDASLASDASVPFAALLITPNVTRHAKQGDVLFVNGPGIRKPDEKLQFSIGIAISEPGIVEGKPLLETLQHFADLVGNTALLFKPCLI